MSAAKVPISIVVIGPDASSKSATTGRLITRTISTLGSFEKKSTDASSLGRANGGSMGTFLPAWTLEKRNIERERGINIDIDIGEFDSSNYHVTIVDAPAPVELAKRMKTGISQSDAAILVIGFGAGQIEESQIREHVQLAFANGVKQLIVGVDNMDSTQPAYSEARFEEIKREVSFSITDIGFNPAAVAFVPFSSSQGDNVTEPTTQMPWFQGWSVESAEGHARGMSLIEAIDALLPATSTTRLS